MPKNKFLLFYVLLFFASGFSGLIYESIWSHYLKLFLGHAAYAQTLVLSIFMGGLAVGGYWVSRVEKRIPNLLIGYAVVELIVGVFALLFHEAFGLVTGLAYNVLIPGIGSSAVVEVLKWTLALLLILPQSVLLGATFPLMAGGILKYYPDNNGYNLATLYFSNSFGAAIGVIVNGFVFIPQVGLPGALLIGGFINVIVALAVYGLGKQEQDIEPVETATAAAKPASFHFTLPDRWTLPAVLLSVAAFTGTASFLYEIAWIRMLSLVFGSSTYSFEVMLSAFILGIAIGGLWIRTRIDKLANPLRTLGIIQLVMGSMAALSIVLYLQSFDLMVWTRAALARTDGGYTLFNIINYGSAALLMLPVTICAGMTLPLITKILIEHEGSNRSIGQVYAVNTVGSILGVILASQLVMPLLGLKAVVLSGAILDIALGLMLITLVAQQPLTRIRIVGPAAALWAFVAVFISLDPLALSSGVYRSGQLYRPEELRVIYFEDGKSSSVAILEDLQFGTRLITNNGKPDANLAMPGPNGEITNPSTDEATMMLLPAIGLGLKPDTELVANIGFGSGLTAHTLMNNSVVERVDTIEIEPNVIEGARLFESRVEKAYTDPRSNIVIGDAKTYFVNNGNIYDMIIAEPSNPWVSGVASLFSEEYYGLTKRYLAEDGVFLQWLQVYEIDESLVASIYSAMRKHFARVQFYQVSVSDVVMVASNNLEEDFQFSPRLFQDPEMARELSLIDVNSVDDLRIRFLADETVMDLLFDPATIASNSDFFPIVDNNAPKNLYKGDNAFSLFDLHTSYFIGSKNLQSGGALAGNVSSNTVITYIRLRERAQEFLRIATNWSEDVEGDPELINQVSVLMNSLDGCGIGSTLNPAVSDRTVEHLLAQIRYLSMSEIAQLVAPFRATGCLSSFSDQSRAWLEIMIALGDGNYSQLLDSVAGLFQEGPINGTPPNQMAMSLAYVAAINSDRITDLPQMVQRYIPLTDAMPFEFTILQQQATLALYDAL